MTVSLKASNAYKCGCPRHESETLQRGRNGTAELITSRVAGTHDPRQPHPRRRMPVTAWASDRWPSRA